MSVVLFAGDCCSKVRVSQVLKQCAQNAGRKLRQKDSEFIFVFRSNLKKLYSCYNLIFELSVPASDPAVNRNGCGG